jgi:hypothetical protein
MAVVDHEVISSIGRGLLVLVGIGAGRKRSHSVQWFTCLSDVGGSIDDVQADVDVLTKKMCVPLTIIASTH